MNWHERIDAIFMGANRLLGRPQFHDSTDALPASAYYPELEVRLTASLSAPQRAESLSPVGPLNGAVVPVQWLGAGRRTVIWHAGAGDMKGLRAARHLLGLDDRPLDANVIAIQAPFHSTRKEFLAKIRRLDNWSVMTAAGAAILEAVLGHPELDGAPVVYMGYSLGGAVGLTHQLVGARSPAAVVPVAAGLRVGDVIADGPFSYASAEARDDVRRALNLPLELAAGVGSVIHPVLGQYDYLNPAAVQAPAYGGADKVTFWPFGHITGCRKQVSAYARPFIERLLDEVHV